MPRAAHRRRLSLTLIGLLAIVASEPSQARADDAAAAPDSDLLIVYRRGEVEPPGDSAASAENPLRPSQELPDRQFVAVAATSDGAGERDAAAAFRQPPTDNPSPDDAPLTAEGRFTLPVQSLPDSAREEVPPLAAEPVGSQEFAPASSTAEEPAAAPDAAVPSLLARASVPEVTASAAPAGFAPPQATDPPPQPTLDASSTPRSTATLLASGSGEPRRLAPPTTAGRQATGDVRRPQLADWLSSSTANWRPLATGAAGLAIVLALWLAIAWVAPGRRRGGGGAIPESALAILGRAPLTPQHMAQLLRLGNKLVLVSVGPEGAAPLAEVTDPVEVERLAALCQAPGAYAPSREFQQVLAQLAKEPARGFLGREAASGGRRG